MYVNVHFEEFNRIVVVSNRIGTHATVEFPTDTYRSEEAKLLYISAMLMELHGNRRHWITSWENWEKLKKDRVHISRQMVTDSAKTCLQCYKDFPGLLVNDELLESYLDMSLAMAMLPSSSSSEDFYKTTADRAIGLEKKMNKVILYIGEKNEKTIKDIVLEILKAGKGILSTLAIARSYAWLHVNLPKENKNINDYNPEPILKELYNWIDHDDNDLKNWRLDGDDKIAFEEIRTFWMLLYFEILSFNDTSNRENLDKVKKKYIKLLKNHTTDLLWRFLGKSDLCIFSEKDKNEPLWSNLCKGKNKVGIKLTSEWLSIWFGIQLLEDKDLNEYCQDESYAPKELFAYYKNLSIYILYLLHCIRLDGKPDRMRFSEASLLNVMEARLSMLCEYSYHSIKVPFRIPLWKYLYSIWTSEGILYTAKDAYRDHLFHAIDVCTLGLLILQSAENSGIKIFHESENCSSFTEVKIQWMLASLFHDAGYAMSLCHSIPDNVKFLDTERLKNFIKQIKEQIENVENSFKEEINILLDKCNVDFPANLITDRMKSVRDHSIISAVHFTDMLKNAIQGAGKHLLGATQVIILHDLPNESFESSNNPVAMLLLLCDRLQEWKRAHVDMDLLGRQLSTNIWHNEYMDIKTHTTTEYVGTNIVIKDRIPKFSERVFRFEMRGKDAEEEKLEPGFVWVKYACDFQRMKPSAIPIHIAISYPLSKRIKQLKSKPWEMDMLDTFVKQWDDGRGIIEWIHAARKNDGVSYGKNEETEWVILYCDITQKPPFIPGIPSGMRNALREYKLKEYFS